MKNLLDEMAEDQGPMQRAQQAMRPPLPRRFYKEASAVERDGMFAVAIDGVPARTPARNMLAVPGRAVAEALAAEWNGVGEIVDPAKMPLTRLVNVALDRVTQETGAAMREVVHYARSDLVCYRAGEPAGLVAAQSAAWDPVLAWAGDALGARFLLSQGVRHVSQPDAAIDAVRAAVEALARPFALAAVASATNLAGSALIALQLAYGAATADAAWAAAHVDEDWNIRCWGEDEEAARRRRARRAEFDAAALLLKTGA